MSIVEDIRFAEQDVGVEFKGVAPMLRYVAAINPQATRQEFIQACVAAGYRANTAANRFHESRTFDRDTYGMIWDKEGRLHENVER